MKKLMLSVFALAAVVLSANAEVPSTATAAGKAELITPVSVAKGTNNLEFGKIALGTITTPATVTMTPTVGGVFTPAAVGPIALVAGTTRTVADFDVTGQGALTYAITLPGNLALATGASIAFNTPSSTRSLVSGADKFYVGGVLTLTSAASAGDYTGNFIVTVNYN